MSIVIPTWNGKNVLGQCLGSIYESEARVSYEVIVVDNGSVDRTGEFVAGRFPRVRLVLNKANFGFARAVNQGIRMSEGRYVLCLNNDTMLLEGTLDCLVGFMDEHSSVGAAGPRLIDPNGSLNPSAVRDFISLKYAFFGGEGLPFPLNGFVRPLLFSSKDHDRSQEVAWMPGACLIVRKEVLCDVGLLDDNFFMYNEDMDWCYRMRKKGWKIFLVSETDIVHLKHYSSRDNPGERFRQDYLSKKYFMQKHYSQKEAILFTVLTLVGSLIKLPFHLTRFLLQNEQERERTKGKIQSHREVLKCILGSAGRRERSEPTGR